MTTGGKQHWEQVYATKSPQEVSWTQEVPVTSLEFIRSFGLNKSARIIDIGGGDSRLVDFLVEAGYEQVSVLDISGKALERARQRLGEKASLVTWIESDITAFEPTAQYDIWHDRATFHFITTGEEIALYLSIAQRAISDRGFAVIGTFSENGPKKCSGLPIRQYSEASLTAQLAQGFEKIRCLTEDHTTPFQTTQNFLFCSFRKKAPVAEAVAEACVTGGNQPVK